MFDIKRMFNKDFRNIKKVLKKAKGAFIFTHNSPDGDCVASALSFAYPFARKGLQCMIFTDNLTQFNDIYDRMKTAIGFASDLQTQSVFENYIRVYDDFDMCCGDFNNAEFNGYVPIVVDCSQRKRIARFDEFEQFCTGNGLLEKLIVIDHHLSSDMDLGRYRYIDAGSTSASQLCYETLLNCFGKKVFDKVLSKILFYGIASDTGFFRFVHGDNYGRRTFDICSHLISHSVAPDLVYSAQNGGKNPAYIEYLTCLLNRTEYIDTKYGKVALITDDKALYDRYSSLVRPSNTLYDMMLSTRGISVVVFAKYSNKGADWCDVSLRVSATSDFDASAFCTLFGGGGHRKAAAFVQNRTLDIVVDDIKKKIDQMK